MASFPSRSQPPVRDWPEAWPVSGALCMGLPKFKSKRIPPISSILGRQIAILTFHIRIRSGVPNPTSMFPVNTQMLTGEKFQLLDLGEEIPDVHPYGLHMCSLRGSFATRLRRIIRALLALIWRFLSVYISLADSGLCRCFLSSA